MENTNTNDKAFLYQVSTFVLSVLVVVLAYFTYTTHSDNIKKSNELKTLQQKDSNTNQTNTDFDYNKCEREKIELQRQLDTAERLSDSNKFKLEAVLEIVNQPGFESTNHEFAKELLSQQDIDEFTDKLLDLLENPDTKGKVIITSNSDWKTTNPMSKEEAYIVNIDLSYDRGKQLNNHLARVLPIDLYNKLVFDYRVTQDDRSFGVSTMKTRVVIGGLKNPN